MTVSRPDSKMLTDAFSVIDDTPEIEAVIGSSGTCCISIMLSIIRPSWERIRRIRTRPLHPSDLSGIVDFALSANGICRRRSGFTEVFRRTLPFDWSELTIESEAEASFLAMRHHTVSGLMDFRSQSSASMGIVVTLKIGFTIRTGMVEFLATSRSTLIETANGHRRIILKCFARTGRP